MAKWDFKTQGGQVSRAPIKGLNADTASASQWGGHNSYNPDSIHYKVIDKAKTVGFVKNVYFTLVSNKPILHNKCIYLCVLYNLYPFKLDG